MHPFKTTPDWVGRQVDKYLLRLANWLSHGYTFTDTQRETLNVIGNWVVYGSAQSPNTPKGTHARHKDARGHVRASTRHDSI